MHSPHPSIDALYFRTTGYFIRNLIRNNTPVYIPNDVSGHCYIVSAVRALLREELRRKEKRFVEVDVDVDVDVDVVNVKFHVNPVKN